MLNMVSTQNKPEFKGSKIRLIKFLLTRFCRSGLKSMGLSLRIFMITCKTSILCLGKAKTQRTNCLFFYKQFRLFDIFRF